MSTLSDQPTAYVTTVSLANVNSLTSLCYSWFTPVSPAYVIPVSSAYVAHLTSLCYPVWLTYVTRARSVLLNHCECQEEGTRNVVAECLGKLTLVNAEELLPKLKKYLSSDSALIRSTVVTAIKFTISDQVGDSTGPLHQLKYMA